MRSNLVAPGPDLERYRSYLLFLAQVHLDPRIGVKVSPSDIVQKTLIQAHRTLHRFGRDGRRAHSAWLRKILVRNVIRAARDHHRQRRDVSRERSLDAALERSSCLLVDCLAAKGPSPSERVVQEELLVRVADALLNLPDGQREALLLHYMSGLSLEDVGTRLDRSATAVAGLVYRGLKGLRERLRDPES